MHVNLYTARFGKLNNSSTYAMKYFHPKRTVKIGIMGKGQ